jgi:hypothetical protein
VQKQEFPHFMGFQSFFTISQYSGENLFKKEKSASRSLLIFIGHF